MCPASAGTHGAVDSSTGMEERRKEAFDRRALHGNRRSKWTWLRRCTSYSSACQVVSIAGASNVLVGSLHTP